jgi:DNA-binding CsgD family transcriptional regulator
MSLLSPSLGLILVVTFVFCLAMTVAAVLVSRQLVNTYNSDVHKHFFYYLVAFYGFLFYAVWGQILARALLASIATDAAVIEAVASFVPVLGVPFLFVSWVLLIKMAFALAGSAPRRGWLFAHAVILVVVLLGAWLAVTVPRTPPEFLEANLQAQEAAGLTAVELVYFATFLFISLRGPGRESQSGRKVLAVFALLLCAGFAARSLVASLVLLDPLFGAPALLVYFGSNLAALLYLRARSDTAFKPVRAVAPSPLGMAHVFERHGVTKREKQIVEKICLGKTNKQIADELFISLQTVKDHSHRIYSKLGVKSRMQLVQLMDAAK